MHHRPLALSTLAFVAGCHLAVGLGDVDFVDKGGSDGGGGDGGGDGGSGAGASGQGASGGGVGGMGGVGGVGGGGAGSGGAGACSPLDLGSCPGGKCSVTDLTTGETGCVTAGVGTAWQVCTNDSECAAGLWCDAETFVCHPVCNTVGDCGGAAPACIAANSGGAPIPGLTMCTSDCEPITTAPCDDGTGATTCYYRPADALWDCIPTQGLPQGSSCSAVFECGDGLFCTDSFTCEVWCTPVNEIANCTFMCTPLGSPVTHDGAEYGVCF